MKFMNKDKTTTSENTDAYINVHVPVYAMYMHSVQMSIYICVCTSQDSYC